MRFPDIRIETRSTDEADALDALYSADRAFHFACDPAQPLKSVTVFANDDGPHWHYVGHGLRALEPGEDRAFDAELTFRLAADDVSDPSRAPSWPVRLLNEFAGHARRRRRPLAPSHYLCLPEPIDPSRRVRCGALVADPQLAEGGGAYLQIVGLHERELERVSGDEYERFLGELREREPLLVTRPGRAPLVGGA